MTRFSDIFGQDSAIQTIRLAHDTDRLPHGVIFAGLAGVGKGTTATALAAMFLCAQPVNRAGQLDACGICPACAAMETGAHPDFHRINRELVRLHDKTGKSKATRLSVEVIRQEIVEPAGRKTALGRGKVFIVEEAELMNDAAQNALLKTLEEPPGRTLIVLLTSRLHDLLPTVRSRCQIIHFSPLDRTTTSEELQRRGVPAEDATAAAELSAGSLGVSLRWIEQGTLASAKNVAATMDACLAGRETSAIADVFRSAADAHAEAILAQDERASRDAAVRGGLVMFLGIAAGGLQRRLHASADPADLDGICRAIDALARAEKYLEANVNVSLVLEQLALSLP